MNFHPHLGTEIDDVTHITLRLDAAVRAHGPRAKTCVSRAGEGTPAPVVLGCAEVAALPNEWRVVLSHVGVFAQKTLIGVSAFQSSFYKVFQVIESNVCSYR